MTYNLVEYRDNKKISTKLWNSTYSLCIGIKKRLECSPLIHGTYFKIEPNN